MDSGNSPSNDCFWLGTYSLEEAPRFNALSYVWGQCPDPPVHCIWCSNKTTPGSAILSIAPNLSGALPFLKAFSIRPIWVDAVCINQESREEKERVVPKMEEYYSRAEEVLIWLGPSCDNSGLAIDVLNWICFPERRGSLQLGLCGPGGTLEIGQLEVISLALQNNEHISVPDRDIQRLGFPNMDHPLWSALTALYGRQWFSRLWTFQEAMLARNATVLCGDRSIPWPTFRQLGLKMSDTGLLWINQPTQSFTRLRDFMWPHNRGEWFWLYLRGARDRECALKEDRIYALLGLAPDALKANIKVEYEEDPNHYIRVYRSAAITFIKLFTLDLLLTEANSLGKPVGMPSWCPDWSLKVTSNVIPSRSSAGSPLAARQFCKPDTQNENIIHVNEAQLEKIREVIGDYFWHWPDDVTGTGGPADKMLRWLDRCLDLTHRAIGLEEKAQEASWQTLCAYLEGRNPDNFPPDPILGLQAHRKRLAENRDSIPLSKTALSPEELKALVPLLSYLGILWRGKVNVFVEQNLLK